MKKPRSKYRRCAACGHVGDLHAMRRGYPAGMCGHLDCACTQYVTPPPKPAACFTCGHVVSLHGVAGRDALGRPTWVLACTKPGCSCRHYEASDPARRPSVRRARFSLATLGVTAQLRRDADGARLRITQQFTADGAPKCVVCGRTPPSTEGDGVPRYGVFFDTKNCALAFANLLAAELVAPDERRAAWEARKRLGS